ncbi:UNVERIFIED_CONTAM: hypothetical protein Slati_3017600 [Sesamum latifolium]|uniref:Uncharacterized protein n=1 Tax=Sesamum latifolium TaxID=2727402 RepID=A0AAW2VGZ3_9LAMI
MVPSDEYVRFVREVPTDDDPSEVTSRRAGLGPPAYTGGRRWSMRQAAMVACRLLDEPSDDEDEGRNEEEEDSSLDEEERMSSEEGERGADQPTIS